MVGQIEKDTGEGGQGCGGMGGEEEVDRVSGKNWVKRCYGCKQRRNNG